MKLTTVATSAGGAAVAATSKWTLTARTERGFRQVLYLRFDMQGVTDGLEIDALGCRFAGTFQPHRYDALNSSPLAAPSFSMSKDGKAVIVQLDGAREIVGVTLAPARAVELHRADGRVQADKSAELAGFIDTHFAVQPVDGGAVSTGQLKTLTVRGRPRNVRIGIAGTDLSSPAIFWPTPDAVGQATLNAGASCGKALQKHLTVQWQDALKAASSNPPRPLPAHIDAAIVIQADEPCELSISQFEVPYHLLLTSFSPAGDKKQTLRYGGKRVERHSVFLEFPKDAVLSSGVIRVAESLRAGGLEVSGDNLKMSASIDQSRGVELTAGAPEWAAQKLQPATALTVGGLALGLIALQPGTELKIELHTDQHGSPSGRTIGEGRLRIEEPGLQQWCNLRMAKPVVLTSEPAWLLVQATKGAALWLLESGQEPVRRMEQRGGVWVETSRFDQFRALCRFVPPAAPAAQPKQTEPQPSAVLLFVGQQQVNGTVQGDGTRAFPLEARVNQFLVAARAAHQQATTARVELEFVAGAGGSITVYSPHIAYDRYPTGE